MEIVILEITSRSVCFEIRDGGIFHTDCEYHIVLNGEYVRTTDRTVNSIYDLKPDTSYELHILKKQSQVCETQFATKYESVLLNVCDFGARGDGIQDATSYIQAAILACPDNGTVVIPEGRYRIRPIFLKSNVSVYIRKNAILMADTERTHYPMFPGEIPYSDQSSIYQLGTWEGSPEVMYAGIITGIGVSNVALYGEGEVDGCANDDNWWYQAKTMLCAWRPRMIFLNQCKHISVQGIELHDSPAWVVHPYFSSNLKFLDLRIHNPAVSPNTDGIDPESCDNVDIVGVHFSLGDDCIAVKSGKIYMGKRYKTPSSNIHIRQCYMENGHGAVTVGSEMAGGVKDLSVTECIFRNTDRGLRVKSRRGRGCDAVIDRIVFRRIRMNQVKTPLVVNSFYFCDADGKEEWVQSRAIGVVDETTPSIKQLVFRDIVATQCQAMAAWFEGLPEQKIEEIILDRVSLSFASDAQAAIPAMTNGAEACCRRGMKISNVHHLVLKDCLLEGVEGELYTLSGIDIPEI